MWRLARPSLCGGCGCRSPEERVSSGRSLVLSGLELQKEGKGYTVTADVELAPADGGLGSFKKGGFVRLTPMLDGSRDVKRALHSGLTCRIASAEKGSNGRWRLTLDVIIAFPSVTDPFVKFSMPDNWMTQPPSRVLLTDSVTDYTSSNVNKALIAAAAAAADQDSCVSASCRLLGSQLPQLPAAARPHRLSSSGGGGSTGDGSTGGGSNGDGSTGGDSSSSSSSSSSANAVVDELLAAARLPFGNQQEHSLPADQQAAAAAGVGARMQLILGPPGTGEGPQAGRGACTQVPS